MNIWKKIAGMLCVGTLCVGMLVGCGSRTQNSSGQSGTDADAAGKQETTASNGKKGFVFVSGDVEMAADMDMAKIAEQLGEPANYFEQPSCAAQGIAKIYTYSGFEIETYPDGDKDLIACIVFKDDSVATQEGIDLSMTKEDIIEAYGSDYEETEKSMLYEKNGTKLCFIMDGDQIVSIEYDSPVLN